MAGLGYKDFTAGAVLTAAQVDGYLMEQSVMNFAGTAARGSALSGVVAAGMVAHVGAGTLTVYDGSNWQQFAPIGAANRNILFNGAMQVSQRGTSTASITAGGYYTADRWIFEPSTLGTWTNTIENDAPTGSGLSKSFKVLCTTSDAAPATADSLLLSQRLEGQDLQRVAKGSASAQQLTLSFWVKSNVTGTYICNLYDNDNTRSVSASYTISASATWERKTITFPADATGAFDNDNALSLYVFWWLAAGTTFTSGTLNTTWASATSANRAVGQTNLGAATNNYWQVTGVQLETGSQATAFEFKSFGQDLRECQRYYWRSTGGQSFSKYSTGYAWNTTNSSFTLVNPVNMRVAPTAVESSNLAITIESTSSTATTAVTLNAAGVGPYASAATTTVTSGLTANRPYDLTNNNNTAGYIAFSAEL
jgi:hypothetical protein